MNLTKIINMEIRQYFLKQNFNGIRKLYSQNIKILAATFCHKILSEKRFFRRIIGIETILFFKQHFWHLYFGSDILAHSAHQKLLFVPIELKWHLQQHKIGHKENTVIMSTCCAQYAQYCA